MAHSPAHLASDSEGSTLGAHVISNSAGAAYCCWDAFNGKICVQTMLNRYLTFLSAMNLLFYHSSKLSRGSDQSSAVRRFFVGTLRDKNHLVRPKSIPLVGVLFEYNRVIHKTLLTSINHFLLG